MLLEEKMAEMLGSDSNVTSTPDIEIQYEELPKLCIVPYMECLFLTLIFIGSLYVWKQPSIRSDHPSVIWRRMVSVSICSLVAVAATYYFVNPVLLQDHSIWALLGIRVNGITNAALLSLMLTIFLFAGPIVIDITNGTFMEGITALDVIWVRTLIFAPFIEELVFRACMLPLVIECTKPILAIFICPLFFGAAHLHRVFEYVKHGQTWRNALLISGFQFLYTTIFGAYSAYLFLRTGHLIAPVIVHCFCNAMGFPSFGSLASMTFPRCSVCVISLVLGLISWFHLVVPLTSPELFENSLPWNSTI